MVLIKLREYNVCRLIAPLLFACRVKFFRDEAQLYVKYLTFGLFSAWFNVLRAAAVVSTVTIGLAAACQVVSIAFESRIAKLLTWILCFVACKYIILGVREHHGNCIFV